ncbi:MAG: hypothetical protein DRH23_00955 [Deltaproteobacteria bacterium]|nr:hypothetical protein [Deltaproteobacteria bacterium]MBW2547293.1 hypothetical protein [Deltaproteobacteria bacterium]RLB51931.1 MAG: hypothetical protein DRH23_00955 [Deltaproteobacteria bacterium]
MNLRVLATLLLACSVACGGSDAGAPGGGGGVGGTGGSAGASGSGGTFVPPADSYTVKWGPVMVPSGKEDTQCVVKRLGNAGPISIHEIHNALGATSHHFIVYRVDDTEERPDPYPCTPFTDTFNDPPLIITQRADDRLTLPDGVAYSIEPNQMIRLELHYVNVSADSQMAEATSTFIPIPPEEVEHEADVMFMGDTIFTIPENSEFTLGPSFIQVPSRFNGVNYFAITGHEHKRGTGVYVEVAQSEGSAGTPVYDVPNFQWDEPLTVTHDPPFTVPDGGGFRVTCDWNNRSDKTVGFGTSVNDEMCFFWAYYFPSRGPLVCANGLFPCN